MPLQQLPRRLRYAVYTILACLALVASIPLFELTSLRHRLESDVTDSLGRRLQVGALRFALLPRPNLTLEDAQLTEPDGRTPFVSVRSARFSLGWLALWHGRAELVDGRVQGLGLIVRGRDDGSFNLDDLLTRKPKSDRIDWRPSRIDFVDSAIDWQDRNGQTTRLRNVSLRAVNPEGDDGVMSLQGQLASPGWSGAVSLDSNVKIDRARLSASLSNFRLALNAQAGEWREGQVELNGDFNLAALPWRGQVSNAQAHASAHHGDQLWQAGFKTPELRMGAQGLVTGRLDGQLGIKSAERELSGQWQIDKLAADPAGGFAADPVHLHLQLLDEQQNAQLDVVSPLRLSGWQKLGLDGFRVTGAYRNKSLPRGAIKFNLGGHAAIDLTRERLDWDSNGTLDAALIAAQFNVENFLDPRYAFAVDLARLDLTPYMPADDKAPLLEATQQIDWSWLKDVQARGELKLGELDMGRFRIFNLQSHIEAAGNRLRLEPLSADIYGGKLSGRALLDARSVPRLSVVDTLDGVEMAALVSDTLGIEHLSGRGTVHVDLSAPASSLDALRRGVSGKLDASLTKGALAGFDLSDALPGFRVNLASLASGLVGRDKVRSTRFSALSAHFSLRDGVAENHDLSGHAPLMKLDGEGRVDVGRGNIDYLLRATIEGGSGVAAIDALKGAVVPVQISGSLSAPHYHVDTSGLSQRLAEPAPEAPAKVPEAPAKKTKKKHH